MKKLNLFALMLLLIGQTILGPIGMISASADVGSPDVGVPLTQICDETTNVASGDTTSVCVEAPPISLLANELTVDLAVIHTITATTKLKDPNYRPTMGEKIDLEINFTLPADHNYGNGSTLTYPLPEPLKAVSGSGDLTSEDDPLVAMGTYKIIGGNVVIVFNGNIRTISTEGASLPLLTNGNFNITAEFSSSSNALEQELKLPTAGGEETIQLYFQPEGGKTIDKTVAQENADRKNSTFVEWTVNVNTEMVDLKTGSEFSDVLTGNHKYDPNSLKVNRYTVDAVGNKSAKEDVTASYTAPSDTATNFKLNLEGKYAYEIIYKTIPGDTDNASQTVSNVANFKLMSTPTLSTTIQYGAPLTKSVNKMASQTTEANETATWTVKVNENRKTLTVGTKITDKWTSNLDKHEFTGDITVTGGPILGTDYKVRYLQADGVTTETDKTAAKGFEIELLKPVSEPFEIKYQTKPKDLIEGSNLNLGNTVVRSDRLSDSKTATALYGQNVIRKSNSNLNYHTKTVDWTIVLNSAGYTMTNPLLNDVFENNNLDVVGTPNVDLGSNTGVTYDYTNKSKNGFDIQFTGTVTSPITITYTTKYDVQATTNLDAYNNIGTLKWDGIKYSSTHSNAVVINDQQKNRGYKEGKYNYQTKTFEWEVGINYNFDDISSAVFTDTLSDTQVVDRNSIKVYPLNLSSGGNGSIDGAALTEGTNYTLTPAPLENTFMIEFSNTITQPYRIVYESKDKDNFYTPNNAKDSVSNNATLSGTYSAGPYSAAWNNVTVPVEHSQNLISKVASQTGTGSPKLNWTMNLNWNQSTLTNAVIKDTVGDDTAGNPNQKIYEDSFKICEMNFSGTNSNPTEGICHDPGDGLYDVSFTDMDSTFTITFNQTIDKAYRVKYDTFFLGGGGSQTVVNEAKLTYTSDDTTNHAGKTANYNQNFTFSGSASNTKGQFVITKVDADENTKKLNGAVFELWTAASEGILIERVSESVDDEYTFKSKLGQNGNYFLIETRAPVFYDKESSPYKNRVKVNLNNVLEPINVSNKKFNQAIKLVKTDEITGDLLAGVEFKLQLLDTADSVYKDVVGKESLITDVDGEIYIDELETGDYRLVETVPLNLYYFDTTNPTTVDYKVTDGQTVALSKTATNFKQGDLLIKKTDKDGGASLPGAVFTLNAVGDNTVLYTSSASTTKGLATFTNVKYGEYEVKELTPPTGYVGATGIPNITINDANNILVTADAIAATVKNEKIKQAVTLTKVDEDTNAPLEGAEFKLYDSNNVKVTKNAKSEEITVAELTTGSDGKIVINNLPVGTYYLKEVKAPNYYLFPTNEADRNTAPFIIEPGQTDMDDLGTIKNKRGQGEIVITKVDAADNSILIDGVEFELFKDGVLVDTQTTVNGIATFSNLPYGTYTLVETKAHANYLLDSTEKTILLDSATDGAIKPETIENSKTNRSVTLTKYNSNKSSTLAGAIFELRKATDVLGQDGNPVYEVVTSMDTAKVTTDNKGEVTLKDLPIGEYQFVEIKAPTGYSLDSEPVEFEIIDQQIETIVVEKTNNWIHVPGPGEPSYPGPDPENPGNPGTPGEPTNPSNPGTPGDPNNPEKPVDSNKPGDKENPTKPVDPNNPDDKEDPNKPGTPGEPGTPGTPGNPGTPGEPGTPGTPNPNDPSNVGAGNEQGEGGNLGKDNTVKDPNASVHGAGGENAEGGLFGKDGKPINQVASAGGEKATLPQTGEQSMLYMMIFGFALILMGGMMIGRRKTNE